MSYDIMLVAKRIKDLREIFNFSTYDVSKKLNISENEYLKIENGETDVSVSLLFEIANIFGVELTALITGDNPKLNIYSVVRKDKGLSVERSKKYKYQNLAYNFSHKKSEAFLVTVEPNGSEISLNTHPGQEMNYVLEGSIMVLIDNHEIILNEGDTLYFNSSYPHGMKALNNKTAKFLAIIM